MSASSSLRVRPCETPNLVGCMGSPIALPWRVSVAATLVVARFVHRVRPQPGDHKGRPVTGGVGGALYYGKNKIKRSAGFRLLPAYPQWDDAVVFDRGTDIESGVAQFFGQHA